MAAKTKSIVNPTDKVATVGQVARTMAHILTLIGEDLKKRDERMDAIEQRLAAVEPVGAAPKPNALQRGVSAVARALSLWGMLRGRR